VFWAHVLARFDRTRTSGAQLQVQTSYEHAYCNLPEYTEWRNTTDGAATYRFRASARHTVVMGGYTAVSRDPTSQGMTTVFNPSSRATTIVDAFA